MADYFVIATVDNDRQAGAIENEVLTKLKMEQSIRPLHLDGVAKQKSGWTVLDYGDVIVHLLTDELRRHYDLEGLWNKAHVVVKVI